MVGVADEGTKFKAGRNRLTLVVVNDEFHVCPVAVVPPISGGSTDAEHADVAGSSVVCSEHTGGEEFAVDPMPIALVGKRRRMPVRKKSLSLQMC